MKLADEKQRRRVLTDLDATLFVEAAAGTGKTSLIAGRVAMLLANGCAPQQIAAITFTELAAGELALRIRKYVAALLAGDVPDVLRLGLPRGLSARQKNHLAAAADRLDEVVTSTIHGFCQEIIHSYAIETDLDPGSRVIDASSADAMFEAVFSTWLVKRLSIDTTGSDPIVILSQHDPLSVVKLIRELAELKRVHPTAGTAPARLDQRTDIDFVDAIQDFARWFAETPGEDRTSNLLADLQELARFYTDCFKLRPNFQQLWRLAQPPRLNSMQRRSFNLRPYQGKSAWRRRCGATDGEQFNFEAEAHVARIDSLYRDLLGQIADGLVSALSIALDDVIQSYAQRKREAAVLDFDDLLRHAHDLVANHEAVRIGLSERFRRIFVDEFQDTDRIQAAIIFLIAARERPARWQEARIRKGSLFLVGDPKQAIYRFRGADVVAYNEARAAITAQGDDSIIEITANFRSHETIISYVNRCFTSVLQAQGQPGYVALSATIGTSHHNLPCAAKITVELPNDPPAALQRDTEAALVANVCRRLIGAIPVKRADGAITPLAAGDIALLAPTGAELWRYEQALEAEGLSVASQAGKTLFLRQETQDILALLRLLADPFDTLAFGAFMRGPMVGLTDQELLDISEAVYAESADQDPSCTFDVRTRLDMVDNPLAKATLSILQDLRLRVASTTPRIVLSEAIEKLSLRVVLAARYGSRGARALANLDELINMAGAYDVSGLGAFVRDLQANWEDRARRSEGRIDATDEAIEIVTMHSSKGLEWPVLIPINTSTQFPPPPQFLHRKSDNTLHWVLGGVMPPGLAVAREEEARQETLERQRMWYVTCTRARDLLVVPHLPAAAPNSWSRLVDLAQAQLPELNLEHLPKAVATKGQAVVNDQTPARFQAEAERIAAASPSLTWRRPSDHDRDRAEAFEPAVRTIDDAFEFVHPVGAGRLRGILLHKLMEEILTGELVDDSVATVERRAGKLLGEVRGLMPDQSGEMPDPVELARTALNTVSFEDIAALRPYLFPEIAVWSGTADGSLLSGRADAVAVKNGNIIAVIDWKSDIAPSQDERLEYIGQLGEYLAATGAPRGAVVYMSLGEVVWVEARARP